MARRPAWILVVLFYASFAVTSVVVIARHAADATATAPTNAAKPVVVMADIAYKPTTLTVAAGTEVLFDNKDVAPHTITEINGGGIDSGLINPGRAFKLVVRTPLEYFCAVHPNMKAKIALST